MSKRCVGALAALLLLASVPAAADQGVRMTVTSTDVTTFPDVELTVSVSGPDGRPFVLAPSEVEVWLGDERVPTSVTSAVEVRPVDVVLVLDRSGSMSGQPMADAIAATGVFLDLLGPRDRSALVGLSTRAALLQPLTADRAATRATASSITAGGDTALYDAVALAARHLAEAGRPDARHAVVVLTDGNDTSSTVRREEMLSSLATDTVHAVGLGPAPDVNALGALAAASSAGVVLRAPTSAQLGEAYVAMAERLRADNGIRFRVPVRRFAPEIAVRVVARRDGAILGEIGHRFALPVTIPDTAAAPIVPTVVDTEPAVVARAAPPSEGAPTALTSGVLGGATVLALVAWALSAFGPAGTRPFRRAPIGNVPLPPPARRSGTFPMGARQRLRAAGRAVARAARVRPSPTADLALDRAGHPLGLDSTELIGLRLIALAVSSAAALAAAVVIGADPAGLAACAAWGALAGYVIPFVALRTATLSRQYAIRRSLPTVVDMLALCVEAGLSLDGAFAQVSRRARGPLSDEIHRVMLELQVGVDRRDALRHLALRAHVPEVSRLVNALIQGDALGVGIGGALQDQAHEARTRRRQRAETLARTAPVKMLFPIVFFIFPALFLVILGPAAPRLAAIFDLAR